MRKKTLLLSSLICFSSATFANDMVGKWKTLDDQTGYSRADVIITKNSDGTYSGKISAIRPLPYKPLVEICTKCKGALKNAPYLGLAIVKGFKQSKTNPNEYTDGQILDPLSGNIYKGKAKISTTGKRLTLRGYVGVSALGRNTTWIRAD